MVDSVVDGVVDPGVHFVDFGLEVGWVEAFAVFVGFAEFRGDEVVKFSEEHADDFAGFVVDDCFGFAVPEGGDCVAACVVGVGFQVELFEACEAVEGIAVGGAIAASEEPAVVGEIKVCVNYLNDVFEVF